jgi:hypothetical protein
MARTLRTRTLTAAAVLLAAMVAAAAPADAAERGALAPTPPVEPTNLFSIPTGHVVRSLDLDVSGTGVLLSESGSRPLFGAALGIGDIAQLEVGSLGIVSGIDKPDELVDVLSAGLRVQVPLTNYAQGLAASFQRSGTYQVTKGGVFYDAKVGEFYTVATFANFPKPEHATEPTAGWNGVKMKTHLGAKYIDARLDGANTTAGAFWRPIGGIEIWKSDARARVVGEVNWIADFENDGGERIDVVRVVTGGVRYFFSKHTTLDLGVRHQSNYDGLAESAIQTRLSFSIPTHTFRDRVVGN